MIDHVPPIIIFANQVIEVFKGLTQKWPVEKRSKKSNHKNMPSKQSNNILEINDDVERELLKAISLDDTIQFCKFLEQGLPATHHFSGYWMEDSEAGFFRKSIAEVVVIKNALQIGDILFDQKNIQAQFEYKAAIGYAAVFGTADMIRLMVAKGFDPNKKRYTSPPLLLAIIRESMDCCEALIESGHCNPYAKDQYHIINKENRPLCEAARQGWLDIVRLIVEFKKDNKTLARAAIVAAENSHEEVALYLLDKLNVGRKKGNTQDCPYHIIIPAIEHRLMRIVNRLLEEEPRALHLVNNNATALSTACKHNNIELVKRLISMGADIHAADDKKHHVYTGKKFVTCSSEELLNSAYDPPPGAGDMKIALPLYRQSPSSPLAEAAASGNLEIVQLLIEQGVNPDTAYIKCSRPELKMTLMHDVAAIELARHFGHTAVVDYLAGIRDAAVSK